MIKSFQSRIPLSLKDSFDLLDRSGSEIISWKTIKADSSEGYLEWKQSLWSLTGSASVNVRLKQETEDSTVVTIEVYKPFQVFDPLDMCGKIFKKLEKIWLRNLADGH